MIKVMIDIETLATSSRAVVTQIGALVFDEKSISERTLLINVDVLPQILSGFHIHEDTVNFWKKQAEENPSFVTTPRADVMYPEEAFSLLNDYLTPLLASNSYNEVWAKSPSFDLGIIETHFKFYGIPTPWTFRQIRDCRTTDAVLKAAGESTDRAEVAHNALHDCIAQARSVMRLYQLTKGK